MVSIKQRVRKHLLTQRQALPQEVWQHKSHLICTHLETSLLLNRATKILAYASFRNEPDLIPLLKKLARAKITDGDRINRNTPNQNGTDRPHRQDIAIGYSDRSSGTTATTIPPAFGLPRCQGKDLIWHCWDPWQPDQLTPGAYGILEPCPDLPTLTLDTVDNHDVLLLPAVGCDRHGYRLGYGGGFYDRMLGSAAWASILKIGIVFDFAYLDQLPTDPWDQPLDGVCTDQGLELMT